VHNTVFAHPTIQQHLNSDWIILSNQIVFKILRFNLKEVLTGYGAGGVNDTLEIRHLPERLEESSELLQEQVHRRKRDILGIEFCS
jgi:hypothetical protein